MAPAILVDVGFESRRACAAACHLRIAERARHSGGRSRSRAGLPTVARDAPRIPSRYRRSACRCSCETAVAYVSCLVWTSELAEWSLLPINREPANKTAKRTTSATHTTTAPRTRPRVPSATGSSSAIGRGLSAICHLLLNDQFGKIGLVPSVLACRAAHFKAGTGRFNPLWPILAVA